MATVDELIQDARRRMDRSVEATHTEFNSVRTGRASPALLDRVQVDYYGTATPLKQLATIGAPEPRLLSIQPFDPSSVKAIERGLKVMDSTALSLCMDNDLPIYVFNMGDERNIDRIVSGEKVGTLVSSAPAE
jgi:ribosome recycling factor